MCRAYEAVLRNNQKHLVATPSLFFGFHGFIIRLQKLVPNIVLSQLQSAVPFAVICNKSS
ncbi:hypothetical protein EMIT0373P_11402 [Pseudomonas chlororaphis]